MIEDCGLAQSNTVDDTVIGFTSALCEVLPTAALISLWYGSKSKCFWGTLNVELVPRGLMS